MKNILFVFGTRPEVIKLAPVIQQFKRYSTKYNVIVCNTEQQKELSNQTLSYFDLKADINLDMMRSNQMLHEINARLLSSLAPIFKNNQIDLTFVQGDTVSAYAGGVVSFYNKVPFAHVEAGLRSYNLFEPFPEEAYRQMLSRLATYHFAPTTSNEKALIAEGILKEKIHVVGNTVIDALLCLSDKAMSKASHYFDSIGIRNLAKNDKIVLATIHRRENHGERIDTILKAMQKLASSYSDHVFIIPVHPNPNVKSRVHNALGLFKNIFLLPPLDYPYLVYLMKKAKLILTDSGGIQEEAPTFGCPVLVLRYETERKETIEAGISKLVGANYDLILRESKKILNQSFAESRVEASNPYGDGSSSKRIIEILNRE